jgi:hypothetical protein
MLACPGFEGEGKGRGIASPAPNLLPLPRASMPPLPQYIRKLPPDRPTLSSRRVPALKGAHVTPHGPAASSPSWSRSFIAGRPIHLYHSAEEEGTKA